MPTLIGWRISHLATKILGLLGIVLLIYTVVAPPLQTREVSANGATRLIVNDEKAGPYLFRVGILPGSPKVGNLHLSVLIQSVDGNDAIEDGQLLIQATGPAPGMTAGWGCRPRRKTLSRPWPRPNAAMPAASRRHSTSSTDYIDGLGVAQLRTHARFE